ncbi:hypothetical protein [Sphingomonas rubra]|uniref:Phage shock protein C (PspC) family protein n=1 Tax=Sphingomonas rubra TaxID=634430 RepID=A0A1I5T5L8_9SPHN|nr:hypothetical protein [Sphingomonas rubra]SFP78295.1 phage shock protein C (PspC) family protein [Sphingomonas rubra]
MANTFNRPDTFFGVCEAIGQDLGIHSNWLRAGLGVVVLWQPLWAIAGYLAAGVAILALRLLVPDPRPAAVPVVETANDEARFELAKAA